MLCFELCTPRAHRAQIPSLDNIDDTQRERMRGRTHSVAANFSLLAHSFRIDSSINLRSNSSNLLDYRPIFFHEKEKKETKKENIFLSYIYIKARNRIILFSNTLSIARSFSSRGKLRKERAGRKKRGEKLFIHRLSTLLRVFQSPVEFRILSFPYVHIRGYTRRVTRMSVSVAVAPVANIKEGRARAGVPRENTGRGGGAGFIYVHPVFRDTKHIGRVSL